MSVLKKIIPIVLTLGLFSCGGGGSKFEGKWKPIEKRYGIGDEVVRIEKKGNVYKLYNEEKGEGGDAMSFLYDKERDVLSIDMGQQILDIEYNSKKKTIKMGSRGGGGGWGSQSVELERVK